MIFFSRGNSAIPTFTYDGTLLDLVTEFKYLGITLTRDGSMLTAHEKMADNFRSAIDRVFRIGDSKGIKKTCHAVSFPGLRFDSWSVWSSSSGHFFFDVRFLKNHPCIRPASWRPNKTPGCQERYWYPLRAPRNKSDAHLSLYRYWFRRIIRFWNSLLSSNNHFLEKVVRADLLLANISDTWTYQLLQALQEFPASQQFLDAIRSREPITLKQFEFTLREHIIGGWRELDSLTPHGTHHTSKIMRTYHTHFGVPLGIAPGW